jgi:flavodoxin
MSIRKWIYLGLALVLTAMILVPLVVTRIENYQARQNEQLLPHVASAERLPRRTAVVFFSRSGNTALLARHLAKKLDASLYRLEATDYDLGIMGWVYAMLDARNHEAVISPQTIDLSGHDVIYLGSPIWMYSPAPPIWQFVDQNRFDGKHVVLFNTFNSKFKQEYIDTFRQEVLKRGARPFEHQFIRRGRMLQQISPEEMIGAFDSEWTK